MADIALREAGRFGLASILPRRGVTPARIGAVLGLALGAGPVASQGEGVTLLGTGPGQWLAYTGAASPDWAETLGERLQDVAAVVDQSSAYVLWQIAGADARRLVQKGLPVDLNALPPGGVVVSAIAHLGVIVHYTAPDSYDVFVFRSFAINFHDWLDASIAAL